MIKLVGFAGYAGSGKDTAAQALISAGWERIAFADAVRDAAMALDPIIAGHARLSEILLDCGWDGAKQLPEVRRLLQRLGTEAGRKIHGDSCWVNIARRKALASTKAVVITDVRFANEAVFVLSHGTLIWIERPGAGPCNDHVSEALGYLKEDADITIINDGTVEWLHSAVLKALPAQQSNGMPIQDTATM